MINYKSFHISSNAKLRVKADNIVATVSSKDQNRIDLYIAGIANPFHLPVGSDETAKDLMDLIWERPEYIEKED